jgi:AAA family ATP:ADP antiporter
MTSSKSRIDPSKSRLDPAFSVAMLAAAAVTAQFVGGKALRDALFLAQLDVTSLSTMVIAAAVVSMAMVVVSSKIVTRLSPARFVPLAFMVSAILLLAEWGLVYAMPTAAAIIVYLHISGLGPMLGSGFWLIASERFDPRTAKRRFGQIAGAGTLGGLLGGALAERVGSVFDVGAMLPILAVINVFCAWKVAQLARIQRSRTRSREVEMVPDLAPVPVRPGLQALRQTPYLRNLAALVGLGTISAGLLDYLFKVQAVASLGNGDSLLRFFAVFYAATSLITFIVQTSWCRLILERFGLGVTAATPSMAILVGGAGALIAPGLESTMVARGGEYVLRGSLFRSSYEVFYTPLPPGEKRAAKSLIDVGFDRVGEALSGGAIWLALLLAPPTQYVAILGLAMVCSVVAIAVATRLNRGYIQALEDSLLNRAVDFDLSDSGDMTTRTTVLRTLRPTRPSLETRARKIDRDEDPRPGVGKAGWAGLDPELQEIMDLRSRDRDKIREVLWNDEGLTAPLVPYVVELLAWDPVADDAMVALRKVAEERVGALIDALIDPNQDFAVRRRLARVFSVCVSQRAADGVLLGLEDLRFEVRFQCGRSLAAILEKNPRVRIDKDKVFEVVRREVAVGRPVWESHRLLDNLDVGDHKSFVDQFVKDRASQSLAHVFTLLSLVLPTEPLQIAFRGLQTDDQNLRGTALEYLEGMLPPPIRERLWPYLEDHRATSRITRGREEILADLLRSNQSIVMSLEELKRQTEQDHDPEIEPKGAKTR